MLPHRTRLLLILAAGVLAVSTAAIFIRLAQDESAPSLVLAAARLTVAALVLTPVVFRRHKRELQTISRQDLKWAMIAGIVLGLHFATWISSLEYTAVVNSVVLVTTAPLWVAMMAPLFLGEKMTRWTAIGLGLALGGGILVALSGDTGEPSTRHDPLLGNGLALFGAVMAAIYFMVGRRLRARLSVTLYAWMVYSSAAILLISVVIISGQRVTGFPAEVYLWMILMGLIPQLIGHSAFNYALGYLPAAYVSLMVLGEPLGSGILAILLLGEWPVLLQVIGSAFILGGIIAASRVEKIPADV
jgi:drug/metabolite transporter (DMT)-like permease